MSKRSRATLDLDLWSAWADRPLTDWHSAIEELAQEAWTAVTEDEWSFVSQGLEDARQAGKIDESLEKAFHRLFWKVLRVSAVFGYALARTQLGSLDEFADWPQRALELAGLKIQRDADAEEEEQS